MEVEAAERWPHPQPCKHHTMSLQVTFHCAHVTPPLPSDRAAVLVGDIGRGLHARCRLHGQLMQRCVCCSQTYLCVGALA
eukprot:scaffold47813_cov20-Tisochrysis_lutea.AAC.1